MTLVLFYSDGSYEQTNIKDNLAFDLTDPANKIIERIFIGLTAADCEIAIQKWSKK